MNSKFLIINADDFGMCHSVNNAVEELFNNGFITSATLMTPCPWALDALKRAKANKRMSIGLHLTLNSEWDIYRWKPVSGVSTPTLLDSEGYMPKDPKSLLKQAMPADVHTEIASQLDWMLSRGYCPTHIDNHMGSLYGLEGPSYLDEVFRLCSLHRFPFRLPRFNTKIDKNSQDIGIMLAKLAEQADRLGINIIDNLFNFGRSLHPSDTYDTVKAQYLSVISSIPPGINELYIHPAKETDELKAICPSWQMRVWEYQLMLDKDLQKVIESENIYLVSWANAPFKL